MSISHLKVEDFRRRNRIDDEHWKSARIEWPVLQAIGANFEERLSELTEMAALHARLLQRCSAVHSVRWRLKEPEHALEKIVRKRAQGSDKYAHIDATNYTHILSDLIGLRALHLFKADWQDIHVFLSDGWTHSEAPIAYVREGDGQDIRAAYASAACKVETHPKGYRSVHYVVSSRPQKDEILAEVQVRTIFEEGWSEVDHRVRYPNFSDNPLLQHFLGTFNRIAGSADELGSFVRTLSAEIERYESDRSNSRIEIEKHLSRIEELVSALAQQKERTAAQEKQLKQLASEAAKLRLASAATDSSSLEHFQKTHDWSIEHYRPKSTVITDYDQFKRATERYRRLFGALDTARSSVAKPAASAPSPKKRGGDGGA